MEENEQPVVADTPVKEEPPGEVVVDADGAAEPAVEAPTEFTPAEPQATEPVPETSNATGDQPAELDTAAVPHVTKEPAPVEPALEAEPTPAAAADEPLAAPAAEEEPVAESATAHALPAEAPPADSEPVAAVEESTPADEVPAAAVEPAPDADAAAALPPTEEATAPEPMETAPVTYSRPASAKPPMTAEDDTARPSDAAPPAAGSRPASAKQQATSSRPASAAPSAAAADATSTEPAADAALTEPAAGSRPISAAAAPSAGDAIPAAEAPAAAESRPDSAARGDAPAAAGSRPASAPAVPPLATLDRPQSANGPAASPRQPASSRSTKTRMIDSVYDPMQFVQAVDATVQMPLASAPTVAMLSLDAHRRNNLAYIEDDVLVMAAGNRVVFLRLPAMTQTYLSGLDGGSIGAVAVHPSRRYLAVAEKCRHRNPNVYVYRYPELTLVKVLGEGTEHAYSALSFNDTGDQLATVGGWPDYLITLWRWEEEAIVLRSKAFSQDVYTVKFSPYFSGNILTSGTGHIRFWKMASTFTGLKLQGQIGKFGNVELTDVAAFVELPDGKVLSGTETGELLMWDGGLIKVVLTRSNRRPCHEGQVNVLMHDRGSNTILSGGSDGYVRLWDFNKINDAEPDEDSNSLAIAPVDEVLITPGGNVRNLLWERRHWLVLDGSGSLIKVDLPQAGLPSKGATTTRLLDFHAKGIVSTITSPNTHVAMTASMDGSVRVYDYVAKEQKAVITFGQPVTCMAKVGTSATTALVGFKDGVVRVVMRLDGGLRMLNALKPHKGAVSFIALSNDQSTVVTGGKDSTVFFFSVQAPSGLVPICYIKLPAPALCASWSPDNTTVLLGLDNGMVLEVTVPTQGSIDTHKTFETTLPTREYTFHLPKPRKIIKRKIPVAEPAEATPETEETGETAAPTAPADSAALAADASAAVPAGVEGDKAAIQVQEIEEEVVIEDDEFQEQELFQVLTLTYAPSGHRTSTFYCTLTGKASGTVWRCDLDDPLAEPAKGWRAPACAATSVCTFSHDGRLQLMGTTDGMVRVQPFSKPFLEVGGPYWQAPLHDLQTGRVSAMAVSFDGAYLLTAAYDGTLCLQELHLDGYSPAEAKPSGQEMLVPIADGPSSGLDITNPNEYTLEEAKQKAEQDALEAAAEAKKMGVREYLQQIRSEFEALLAENDSKPEAERLPRSAFEIDIGLREMVTEETARREEAARRELAWETEKRRLALSKLKSFFLDNVEVEHIALYAIRGKQFITTFRTACMTDELLEELQTAKLAEEEAAAALAQRKASAGEADASNSSGAGATATDAALAAAAAAGAAVASGVDTSKMSKADLRRLARKQREAAWAAFNLTRPNDKYEDPADVAAIEEAERNMGDFKLKSDPAYVVPEEERMTPQRKRYQMLLLEETMHNARMDFNQRFLALREVKKKVVSEINARVAKLREIQAQLGKTAAAVSHAGSPVPADDELVMQPLSLKPDEMPEDREKVTDADIEEHLKQKEENQRKAAEGSALGGFAAGGNKAGAGANAAKAGPGASGKATPASTKGSPSPPPDATPASGDDALSRIMAAVPLTDLERQLQGYYRRRLQQQKVRLLEEVEEMAQAFDGALNILRREKFRLEKEIKQCEIRQLVHAQELSLLLDFDKREVVLIQKRGARMEDRNEILEKINECSSKLEIKRTELEGLMTRRAAVAAEFDSAVPDSDPFREPLSKIFYRRIKRSKKKTGTAAGANDAESEDDEDEEDEEEEGDDDDDDDGGEEVCPAGCDQGLFEKVCDLRERRLDEEELVADFTKAIDALRKDRESLAKKQKLVEQSLAAVNADIAAFQQEKQAALNQIDVVVNLHMHQVEYLVDGRLPDDLSAALVFSSTQLDKLRRRIDELEEEKSELRLKHKSLKKEHLQLLKDKADKEARVSELETRAHDVQMLKFGQEVDMELLDALGASRGTEELKAELARQEAAHARELAEWDAKIAQRTDELMALTQENTGALNAVSALTAAQRGLEAGLTATRKTMFADPVTQRRQEVEERDGLVQLVNAQAKELERLRTQVLALKRKDTSVYQ